MDVEQIAAGLSPIQIKKLSAVCSLPRGSYRLPRDGSPSLPVLGKELVRVHSRYSYPWAINWLEPTPLGLAVREYLEKHNAEVVRDEG